MPQVRTLAPEEVYTLENKGKGQRKLTEEEYNQYLADYELGDYGEAELSDDENRLTVRNRFKAAAQRRGLTLDFKRTKGNTLRFKVVSGDGQSGEQSQAVEPEPEPEPVASDAPPKRKGGRPKKQAV
jgi:hypothetical protein